MQIAVLIYFSLKQQYTSDNVKKYKTIGSYLIPCFRYSYTIKLYKRV
jgi:hypothetical protein